MCTLTWRHDVGLELFFNRDELKTRGRAIPPRRQVTPCGVRYLAPTDIDAGGTWMLANEFGIVVCLLNRWHEKPSGNFPKSRGRVVTDLAFIRSLPELSSTLPKLCAGSRPFDLIAFDGPKLLGLSWRGRVGEPLQDFKPVQPLTSSSFQFESVKAEREKRFQNCESLEDFQSGHGETSNAYSVRMNRPDAQTWSRSHVTITAGQVCWRYWEEFPNLESDPRLHETTLALTEHPLSHSSAP